MIAAESMWNRACIAAENTPSSRNRYVDFLRAVSIVAVIMGHWLAIAPTIVDDRLQIDHVLNVAPWTAWLTWAFQVMPVFFIVGGFSNAASWESAQGNGRAYGEWVAARLHRLVGPVVLLVLFWLGLGLGAGLAEIDADTIAVGSRSALIPVWFLSVYIMVTVVAPLTIRAFTIAGSMTFWVFALCALLVDVLGLAGGFPGIRWLNYGFVWLAVHQLGYMWRSGYFNRSAFNLAWAFAALVALLLLVNLAGYPVAMISTPGEEMSNSTPPTVALIALALLQSGLILSLEGPARRRLQGVRLWATIILVNRSIMTLYLWHITVLIIVTGLLYVLGGYFLDLTPGTAAWWISRAIWLAGLAVVLLIVTALLSPIEQRTRKNDSAPLPAWRAFLGASFICFGLAQLALHGIGADQRDLWVTALIVAGLALIGAIPSISRQLR